MMPKLEYIMYISLEGTLEDAVNQLKSEVEDAVKRGFDRTTLKFESSGDTPELWGRKLETEEERIAREAKEEQARQKKLQKLKKDAEQLGYKLVEEQK